MPILGVVLKWPGSFCFLPLGSQLLCKNSNGFEATILREPMPHGGEILEEEMPCEERDRPRTLRN